MTPTAAPDHGYTPSGAQYAIEGFGHAAVVTEVGATLRELTHDGRDLVAGFPAHQMRPLFRGALLAPWPNRIAGGKYSFGGVREQLALNEPDRRNALHGLVSWAPWSLVTHEPSHVELAYQLYPQEGYPFRLDLSASYLLREDGLHCRLRAFNAGEIDAPYGCAPHPYLVAGQGPVDAWTLEVPAEHYLDVTPDRLLPRELLPVDGTTFDFRRPRQIGDAFLDHAFTKFTRNEVRVRADSGQGVVVAWDDACSWVQVHTADRPEPEYDRVALAVEPMTCPPDAFNTGTDLVVLRPGEAHAASWQIGPL